MYRISKEDFGFRLTFGGTITPDEMKLWHMEAVRALVGAPETFGVIFDLRDLDHLALDAEVREALTEGRELFQRSGMRRSCVILDCPVWTAKYRRGARLRRNRFYERYLNAAADRQWRNRAIRWIENNIEPYR